MITVIKKRRLHRFPPQNVADSPRIMAKNLTGDNLCNLKDNLCNQRSLTSFSGVFQRPHKKGQGTLEATITIIITTLLLGGIINIWLWVNNQIVERQRRYNETRVAAGTSADSYQLQWPVYAPEHLTEEKVLLDGPKMN